MRRRAYTYTCIFLRRKTGVQGKGKRASVYAFATLLCLLYPSLYSC